MRSSTSLLRSSRHSSRLRNLAAGLGMAFCTAWAGGQAGVSAPQQFADLGNVRLENGQQIHHCRLGYRTAGTLNAAKSNAVLFPTWFGGRSADLVEQVGPGKDVDSSKFFVILIDALGNGVSCSPSNSADQHGPKFPQFTIRDIVETEHRLATETFHLEHVHAVMGVSMGGMQTFQWMVTYPDFMDMAVPIVGTPRQSSYDVMLWRSEETAITADPAWKNGRYTRKPKLPLVAVIHDMNLATPKYRAEQTPISDAGGYFKTVADKGIGDFDANDWLWQLRAMLTQDVSHGGSLEDAARRVKAKVLVVAARQDHMVNPLSAIEFAQALHAKLLVLEGDCGHRAPVCEVDTMSPVIDAFLNAK